MLGFTSKHFLQIRIAIRSIGQLPNIMSLQKENKRLIILWVMFVGRLLIG